MPTLHQLLAGARPGDAITNEALTLRRLFRSWGLDSEIYCERRPAALELRDEIREAAALRAGGSPSDILLLHLSSGSPVNELFAERPGRKILRYHNITPPEFFEGLQDRAVRLQGRGREQMRKLAGAAALNLAVSRFNAEELTEAGYPDVRVLPLWLDGAALRTRPHPAVLKRYRDDAVNVLFVGRCAPNKKIEDGLAAFYYFQKFVEPRSRFIHVGASLLTEPYHALLLTYLRDLELNGVELVGAVRQDELNAYYRSAHLFLCMSEHEGFCLPLLESMAFDVPVLAYAAAAVPEALDGAGVLFREKRFDLVAELMGRLTRDAGLREAVLRGQRERLKRYQQRDLAAEWRRLLEPWLG